LLSAHSSLLSCILRSTLLGSEDITGYGNSADFARAIAVDVSGNVYVTGGSSDVNGFAFCAIVKYNSTGVQEWVQIYSDPESYQDYTNAIAVDPSGNVYVTGASGTYPIYDYATIKYNSAGIQQWVKRYNGPENGHDEAYAIAVDGSDNVYVTGQSVGSGTSYDFATIKYNSNGDTVWVRRYNGPGNSDDEARAIAVDDSGNMYVTGYSYGSGTNYNYATIKYNSEGVEQWVQRYNGPGNDDDRAYSLVVDSSGNVYVTGYSIGSTTSYDYATIKYNSAGVQQWVQRYNGPVNGSDYAYAIANDASGNIYVTGYSESDSIDPHNYAYATVKYNSAGQELWVQRYDGPGNYEDVARAIVVDASGNVYVTGYSVGLGTSYDYATIKYVQIIGAGENDIASLPLAKTSGIEVYPNPARTYFTIRVPQTA
jgi:uncharacterized delta-60 repeat protein